MPSQGIGRSAGLGPFALLRRRSPFCEPALATNSFTISGVTYDAAGLTLGSCTVTLFRASDNTYLQQTVSDSSGNYSFTLWENAGPYYVLAIRSSLALAGTTLHTVLAT